TSCWGNREGPKGGKRRLNPSHTRVLGLARRDTYCFVRSEPAGELVRTATAEPFGSTRPPCPVSGAGWRGLHGHSGCPPCALRTRSIIASEKRSVKERSGLLRIDDETLSLR